MTATPWIVHAPTAPAWPRPCDGDPTPRRASRPRERRQLPSAVPRQRPARCWVWGLPCERPACAARSGHTSRGEWPQVPAEARQSAGDAMSGGSWWYSTQSTCPARRAGPAQTGSRRAWHLDRVPPTAGCTARSTWRRVNDGAPTSARRRLLEDLPRHRCGIEPTAGSGQQAPPVPAELSRIAVVASALPGTMLECWRFQSPGEWDCREWPPLGQLPETSFLHTQAQVVPAVGLQSRDRSPRVSAQG